MANLGGLFLIPGVISTILEAGVSLGSKAGLTLGRVPGDTRMERHGGEFCFPIATSRLFPKDVDNGT